MDQLRERFNILFELKGKLSKDFHISAKLVKLSNGGKLQENPITVIGRNKNSILKTLINDLTREIYSVIFLKRNIKQVNISDMYGTDWRNFSYFFKGVVFLKKHENDKAESFLKRAKNVPIADIYLADLYYFNDQRSESQNKINGIIIKMDNFTEMQKLKLLARKASLDFNLTEQVDKLEIIKNKLIFAKEVYYELGEAYFHRGNALKAKHYYEEAIKLDNNYTLAHNHLGYCYSYLGEHSKALNHLNTYRELDQTPNSFDSLGDGYYYAGEYENAIKFKNEAIRYGEKGVPWSHLVLADINILKQKYLNATNELDKYGKFYKGKKKEKAYILSKKSFMRYEKKKYKEALKLINTSLATYDNFSINDNTTEAHWIKGRILLALGKISESKIQHQDIKKIIDRYNLSGENYSQPYKYYLHLKAMILEAEGKEDEAVENLRELMKIQPQLSYWITYYNYQYFCTELAGLLYRKGDYSLALTATNKCLKFNPQENYFPALLLKLNILKKTGADDNLIKSVSNKIREIIDR